MTFRFDAPAALERIRSRGAPRPTVPIPPTETGVKGEAVGEIGTIGRGRADIETLPPALRDAWEERAAIILEAHCQTLADDGMPLAESIFHMTRAEAERLALLDVLGEGTA